MGLQLKKHLCWVGILSLLSNAVGADDWGLNVQTIAPQVYSAGTLEPSRIADIAKSGIATVVNLRYPEESQFQEGPAVGAAGMQYVNFPIKGGVPDRETVAKFSAIIQQYSDAPLLVHCASGNRVGILWGAHLLDQGMQLNAVLAQLQSVNTRNSSVAAIRKYAELHFNE